MRTKVYSFKPKGKGYHVYATKTSHSRRGMGGSSRSSGSRRSGGACLDFVSGVFARFLVHGVLGMKK